MFTIFVNRLRKAQTYHQRSHLGEEVMFERKVLDLGNYEPVLVAPGVGIWRYQSKLPLTTDGHLRIIFLGVGAAFSAKMFQSNMIVVKGDTALFVDLGSKTTLKMAEFGLTVHDIQHIMPTHSHADHIGSFEELALKKRYEAPFIHNPKLPDEEFALYMERILAARHGGKHRPNLYTPFFYSQVLYGWSLRGGLAFNEDYDLGGPRGEMLLEHLFNLILPTKLDGFGVDSWSQDVGGIRFQTFVTKHIPDATGRVTESMYSVGMVIDGRVYYSGDTKFDQATTLRFGSGCELLFHDCQHFNGGVHASYEEVKTLPEELRARMLLYHLTDPMVSMDVKKDGFLGLAEPAPVVYDFID